MFSIIKSVGPITVQQW